MPGHETRITIVNLEVEFVFSLRTKGSESLRLSYYEGYGRSNEYCCLVIQQELGGKFLLKLNTLHETDSSQVPRGNVEKHSDKRVKSV